MTVPLDTTVESYGEALAHIGGAIYNASKVDIVGKASWSVTAERLIGTGATNVSARMEVALFKNAIEVPGVSGRMTSSRRSAPGASGEGDLAVNNVAGSTIIGLSAGDFLQLKVRKQASQNDDDNWVTVDDQCSLTVIQIPGVTLN